MKNDDLIFRSALKEAMFQNEPVEQFHPQENKMWQECFGFIENATAVEAVPVEVLGKWGKLLLPCKGDPRGPVGRMGDGHLKEEALYWGVVTDAGGGRWVPVQEAVLLELIEKAKANDPESLRPKGKWRLNKDGSGTCSECHRIRNDVWDMDNWDNFCSHCGADMRGELTKENEARLIDRIKRFWERHFKPRCPDCGGVMDGNQFDMEIDKVVYTCRECNKEWV